MRWAVVGARGMLGTDLVSLLEQCGEDVKQTDAELDIRVPDSCEALVENVDVVVNCAAWTAVDAAEDHEAEAFDVNAVGVANLAHAAAHSGARMVQISTDYIFDGQADHDYPEDHLLAPRSAYGRTKAAGEWATRAYAPDSLIVRTAWLYGASGKCFPKTIARLLRERGSVSVVSDQLGQPTWTRDVAQCVYDLVTSEARPGNYHATSSGLASWYEFAQAIAASLGLDPETVAAVDSESIAAKAPRPAYSGLGHASWGEVGPGIADWRNRWVIAAPEVLELS